MPESVAALVLWWQMAQALTPVLDGLPPLSDLARFPDHACAEQSYTLAYAHTQWLATQLAGPLLHRPWYERWSIHAHWRKEVWSTLDDATNCAWAVARRRERLDQLRLMLGPDDYAAGVMPCPVPLEFFHRRD